MLVSHALLVPHLPTLMLDEHRGHRTEMLEALAAASGRLEAEHPEVLVVLSARWDTRGPFLVDTGRFHRTITDYPGFGVEVRYDCPGHPALARALAEAGRAAGVRAATAERGVDSGVTVPLHFLVPLRRMPVVPLSLARRAGPECRAWGAVLRRALAGWRERVAFVVGGVLSLNLHAWNLKREVPEARAFDESALEALKRGAWDELPEQARRLAARAQPEAGLRHLEVLRGFLGADVPGEVRCYEGAPGVGAALVEFALHEAVESRPAEAPGA